uniref:Integrase catalytic domain-containing protein n=1 Tax=Tanacetum cinerariifolium TaxID=118510 RepID=A0A6L2JR18_TANCI|nr:hypothetical protein [Tanacetum cinerariifolium]
MLLAMKDEAGRNLKVEENDFMLDNSYGDETLEEIIATVMMMAQIQLDDGNAEIVPSYDAKPVSEVNASPKVHEQVSHEKRKTIIYTFYDDQIDSSIIFDDPYVENNGGTSEHDSNAHDEYHETQMMAYNVQRKSKNQKQLNNELKKQKDLLQKELKTIKDKKGVENLAADHLSRLENPNIEILTKKDTADEFPDENLMMLKVKLNEAEPRICSENIMRRCVARKEILEILAHCYSRLTVDTTAPLGKKCILVAADYVSKWVEAQALPTTDACVVVKFLRYVFARFIVPKALISDRGTHLCNSQLEKALQKYGVHHRVSTAYHPQSNGQTKVTNRAIKRNPKRSVGYNPKDWSEYLTMHYGHSELPTIPRPDAPLSAAVNNVPRLVDKKGGSYAAIALKLEPRKFSKRKKRMLCYLVEIKPYYLKCIKDGPFKPKTAEGGSYAAIALKLEPRKFSKRKKRMLCYLVEIKPYYLKCIKDDPFKPKTAEGLRNADHTQTLDLADIYGRFVYEDYLIQRRYLDTKKAFTTTPSRTAISTAFLSNNVIHDFQENFDDEVDERSSEEYLKDLDIEFYERAFLKNSKCFIKRRKNFSSKKANENTECYKCGKKANPKVQKDYKAEYKKIKAKLALLEANPSTSQTPKTLQPKNKALADDELTVRKNHACNGEWIYITMRKVERLNPDIKLPNFNIGRVLVPKSHVVNESLKPTNTSITPESSKDYDAKSLIPLPPMKNLQGASLSSEVMPLTLQPHTPKKRPGLGIMKHTKPETQDSLNKSVSGTVIVDETEPTTPSVPTEVKDTEQESNINELTKLVRMLIDGKVKNKIYRFNKMSHLRHDRVIHIRGGVLAESSSSSESSIGVKYNTCGSTVHSTIDHNEFDYFKRDIYAAGSENRPPMLNKENYVPWLSRLLRYAKSRPNEKLIYNSIMNGPYVKRMIPEPCDAAREVPVNETFYEETNDELTEKELIQVEAKDRAI